MRLVFFPAISSEAAIILFTVNLELYSAWKYGENFIRQFIYTATGKPQ